MIKKLFFILFLHTLFLLTSETNARPAISYYEQEIHYTMPEVGQVVLVWGVNGWQPLPDEIIPPGTILRDGTMRTPMVIENDRFMLKLTLPEKSKLNFGFLIEKDANGKNLQPIWTGDQPEITIDSNGVTEVTTKQTLDQLAESDSNRAFSHQGIYYEQEIRYTMPEAGQVFLVWGVNGWQPLSDKISPPGTILRNGTMRTPMVIENDRFMLKLTLPEKSILNFGFLIEKDANGKNLHPIWTGDQPEITIDSNGVTEVTAKQTLDQLVEPDSNWSFSHQKLLGGVIVLIIIVLFVSFMFKRSNQFLTIRFISSIFFIILVTLLLAEFGWRLYLYQTGKGFWDDPQNFISPFFTTYEEPRPFFTSQGAEYRNGHVSLLKPPGEIRIITFGGSTTVNNRAGISYAEILEEKFKEQQNDSIVRVLNAGGEGFSSAHTLVNLALRNLEIQPDIITVYHNINDLSANWFGDNITLPDYANKYKTDFYLDFRHRTGFLAGLINISRLARFIVSTINVISFPEPEQNYGRDHTVGLEYFTRNLNSIIVITKANNIQLVLATQAAQSEMRDNPAFKEYNDAIRNIAEKKGVPFIDIAAALHEDTLFLDDKIHYTREGVERLANEFYHPLNILIDRIKRVHK